MIVSLVVNSDERRQPSATLDGKLGSRDTFPKQFSRWSRYAWGQGVAGSNPVSPTSETPSETVFQFGRQAHVHPACTWR